MTLDRDFYKDYGEETGEYNAQYLESTAFLTKHWERYSLTTELKYYEDLYADSNGATLQRLPTITFTSFKQQLADTPFFVSLDSNFTNFHREHGIKGQRLDLQPTLAFYTSPGSILEGAAWVGYRERIYNTYGGTTGDNFDEMGMPVVGASLSSTLTRVYDVNWGRLKKLKHTVIPQIEYSYTPQKDQDDLPFFDYDDRLVAQNMLGYSFTNYLTGKYLTEDNIAQYVDLAYFRISQGYEFSDTRRDVLAVVDERRPFTDIRAEARVNLLKWLHFNLDSRFNPYELHFTTANVGIDVSDKAGNSAGFLYRFSRDTVNYLEGRLNISYVKPFIFHYATRYSLDSSRFLESIYALEFKQQCWGVSLSYQDRIDNQSFLVNFTLSGIGSLGKIKAF
jgi:LPS-assembly protein